MIKQEPVIFTRPPLFEAAPPWFMMTGLKSGARTVARSTRDALRYGGSPFSRRGGHSAVTVALLKGLRRCGLSPTYNPVFWASRDTAHVGIVGGVDSLQWATDFYREGQVPQISVGPNVVVRPTEASDALMSRGVRSIITPSPWVSRVYASLLPDISHKLVEWPAGVDTSTWTPSPRSNQRKQRKCLIYIKGGEPSAAQAAITVCSALGFRTAILEYSKYKAADFLRTLRQCAAMVVIGGPESQGLAMFEAWAVGVPTFVQKWDPVPTAGIPDPRILGNLVDTCTSPFLSNSTGRFWATSEELAEHLSMLEEGTYSPREWIMNNGTLEISALNYLSILYEGPLRPKR